MSHSSNGAALTPAGERVSDLGALDFVELTVLVENTTDMLLQDVPRQGIARFGLVDHFRPPHGHALITENGLSVWIRAISKGIEHAYLFDTGLTGQPCLHNMTALGLDVDNLDAIVISHAHPDHYGGLVSVLEQKVDQTPVIVHPDAFLPKWWVDASGEAVMEVNEGFRPGELARSGARIVPSREPLLLSPGVVVTGAIPRSAWFEPPVPHRSDQSGIFIERDGGIELDDACADDQAIVLNIGSQGLVVLTACGHSGVVNTVQHAQDIFRRPEVAAVIGGFHLGFPGVPRENIAPTMDALAEVNPGLLAPIHCSGFPARTEMASRFGDRFAEVVVGTSIQFGSEIE